ncbi:MAG TPA: YggT family protein [Rhodanobacteraceae bacterium]|jgi:YggT family protein|nr:YggT family protein [Rhodanobacteraceae bacterium]
MTYLANALALLIQFAFGCAVALFVFRLLTEAVRADFYNPICQFLYRATNPVLTPLRRVLPTWRRINLAALVVAWVLEVVKNFLLRFVAPDFWASNLGTLVLGFADLLNFFMIVYLIMIFAWALLSYVNIDARNPLVPLLGKIVDPVLKPLRKRVPLVGGFDLSPMLAILVILLVQVAIVAWLMNVGHTI